jgi:hypothetical protein
MLPDVQKAEGASTAVVGGCRRRRPRRQPRPSSGLRTRSPCRIWLLCLADVPEYHPRMVAIRAVVLLGLAACGRVVSGPMSSSPDATACPGLLCSGFELEESGLPWTLARDSGAVVEIVSRTGEIAPHDGTHMLHVLLTSMPSDAGNSSQAAMYHSFTASPYTSGELYARAWFQVPALNPGIVKNHIDLFTLDSAGHHGEEIALYLPGDPESRLDAWIDPNGSPQGIIISPSPPMLIPTGSWFCVALHVTIGLNGSLEFDVNQTRSGPQATRTLLNDGVDEIGVGLLFVDSTMSMGTSELYVDDVAVSTSPLSCP